MENSIEEDIEIVENILHKGYTMSILHPSTNIRESEIKAIEHILSDYKRVLKENEKYKGLAEMNLKSAEEFKNNMCEHRCLLKSENKEQKELIEKMKIFLLKENTMCDFLESEK